MYSPLPFSSLSYCSIMSVYFYVCLHLSVFAVLHWMSYLPLSLYLSRSIFFRLSLYFYFRLAQSSIWSLLLSHYSCFIPCFIPSIFGCSAFIISLSICCLSLSLRIFIGLYISRLLSYQSLSALQPAFLLIVSACWLCLCLSSSFFCPLFVAEQKIKYAMIFIKEREKKTNRNKTSTKSCLLTVEHIKA